MVEIRSCMHLKCPCESMHIHPRRIPRPALAKSNILGLSACTQHPARHPSAMDKQGDVVKVELRPQAAEAVIQCLHTCPHRLTRGWRSTSGGGWHGPMS